MESEEWNNLVRRRQKCLPILDHHAQEKLQEITDIECLLAKLWTQLESHCRAPNKYPPPGQGNLLDRWANQVVIPLAVASQIMEHNQGET